MMKMDHTGEMPSSLRLCKERRAVPVLLDNFNRLSGSPIGGVRHYILEALELIADPRAIPLFLAVLRSSQLQNVY